MTFGTTLFGHVSRFRSLTFAMAFHPTFTPVPRTSDEKHRSKSPPPRAPKPTAPLASSASASRPVPVQNARATKPPATTDERPLAFSLEKDSGGHASGAGGGGRKDEGLGGEPFATYADDVRELVAALQRALKEEEEEEEREQGEKGPEKSKLSEAASVTRAFLHQQLRLAGDAERRSLAELRGAVRNLLPFEERREELRRRRRRREAGAAAEEEEGGEEGKQGGEQQHQQQHEQQPERLSEELKKEVRRGLEATLAVLLVEEESAREKGLLH